MEWLFLPLIGIVGWVLGVIGFFKSRRALAEVAALRVAMQAAPAAAAVSAPVSVETAPAPEPEEALVLPEPVLVQAPEPEPARPRVDLEVLLTQRWGIWLGAAALLLAAVFLVRTA